jgi:alanyl-tRNA synthetase
MGLNRVALLKQGVDSVFETDQFAPLIALGEELSGVAYGSDFESDRSLRILADHTRGMTFLVADGVVPSNADRGYVLRRVMRRAIQHGRRLGMEQGFLLKYSARVQELMGHAYGELDRERSSITRWLTSEEEAFGRTLEQGTRLLDELIDRARERGDEGIAAEHAFKLHDTFGFPIDLTLEIVTEHGLGVDQEGFEVLMNRQRSSRAAGSPRPVPAARATARPPCATGRWRSGAGRGADGVHRLRALEQHTTVGAVDQMDGRVLVKLAESPFYATGGGQIADSGVVECEDGDCRARVADVLRLGDDQAVVLEVETGR